MTDVVKDVHYGLDCRLMAKRTRTSPVADECREQSQSKALAPSGRRPSIEAAAFAFALYLSFDPPSPLTAHIVHIVLPSQSSHSSMCKLSTDFAPVESLTIVQLPPPTTPARPLLASPRSTRILSLISRSA